MEFTSRFSLRMVSDMIWAFKMFFKLIGKLLLWVFTAVLTIVVLPFYGIYLLCGGKPPKAKKEKKSDDDSWRDRYDWVAGWW